MKFTNLAVMAFAGYTLSIGNVCAETNTEIAQGLNQKGEENIEEGLPTNQRSGMPSSGIPELQQNALDADGVTSQTTV
jgi:hypothetical protein